MISESIRKNLDELNRLFEDSNEIELKDNPSQQEVLRAWPHGILYRGEKIFETYVELLGRLEPFLKRECEDLDDMQECYLGYDSRKDVFVIGFDAWFSEDQNGNIFYECTPSEMFDNAPLNNRNIHESDAGIFYDRRGGYQDVKKTYKGILDLRLD